MTNNRHVTHPVTRDLPHSVRELFWSWAPRAAREVSLFRGDVSSEGEDEAITALKTSSDAENEVDDLPRNNKYWAIITTGAGLFSDGYINNSIGTTSLCLSMIYGKQYTASNALKNVSSIAFVGTVVGQLSFGYLSDYHSRRMAMLVGTLILIVFSILCAGAWGVNTTGTNAGGLFAAITAYRFFLGVGIGSEYPAGSTAAAEASNTLPAGRRNRWFCWFTNFMIDTGFVVSSVVPLVMLRICGEKHLQPVWRVTLGLGAIPPISLFFLRLKYKEGKRYVQSRFNHAMPYWRIIKFYWFRLTIVSIIWFIYDFSSYSFGTYSSIILDTVLGDDASLTKSFGWNIVFNLFYIPGAFLGAIFADYWGPRNTLVVGVTLQAVLGFIMAGCLEHLRKHIGGFVVVFGIFSTLGEFGPGDNIGCLASKTSATPVRGHYYGIAAAVGKIGAFVGTYVFPIIMKRAGGEDTTPGLQAPFWVSASLCLFAAFLALFFLPPVDQESNNLEDELFIEYLESTGYDTSLMGTSRNGHQPEAGKVTSAATESLSSKEVKDQTIIN
ncbi:LAMI_0D11606g1_1 [Lachancea mirantina]|uniref:LAMI_0D11606g1_1 n=1 Tax=Lachancea mirantina TaxID=1230905 RepID=A0A1G4JFV9_9SACH|nr:LAMI_0D11606g1_1 [Lachancea mirantina]